MSKTKSGAEPSPPAEAVDPPEDQEQPTPSESAGEPVGTEVAVRESDTQGANDGPWVLPPHRQEVRCAKCGSTDGPKVEYHGVGGINVYGTACSRYYAQYDAQDFNPIFPEHLDFKCHRCGYCWLTEALVGG